ncbi:MULTISPECIES: hypothetical protein [Micrococcus]|nr:MULTISPECIES: hypothetical protein [Micrococcus]
MRLSMALAAALAAVVLSAAAFVGPLAVSAVAIVVILVIAWGWPRQLGSPARISLSVTLAVVGLVSLGLTLLWGHVGLGEPEKGALGLFQPMAVVAGWGVIAAFMVQLFRGTGRPLRLESTVATMGGVMIVVMTSGWAALAQWNALPLAPILLLSIGATVALVSLLGLTPWMQGRPGTLAAVLIPLSVLIAVASGLVLDAEPRKLAIAAVAALASSTLVALTAATAPSAKPRPEDRPVATTLRPRRAGFALAMAPVGAAGVIGHVILALLG